MLAGGEKVELSLTDIREHHTDTTVSFTIKMSEAQMASAMKKGLHKVLKLSSSVATTNMTLFDEQSRIQKHATAEGILRHFFTLRLSFYEKRKLHLAEQLTNDWTKLDNKMRFVNEVVTGKLKISNRKKLELVAHLQKDGYVPFEPEKKKKTTTDGELQLPTRTIRP